MRRTIYFFVGILIFYQDLYSAIRFIKVAKGAWKSIDCENMTYQGVVVITKCITPLKQKLTTLSWYDKILEAAKIDFYKVEFTGVHCRDILLSFILLNHFQTTWKWETSSRGLLLLLDFNLCLRQFFEENSITFFHLNHHIFHCIHFSITNSTDFSLATVIFWCNHLTIYDVLATRHWYSC